MVLLQRCVDDTDDLHTLCIRQTLVLQHQGVDIVHQFHLLFFGHDIVIQLAISKECNIQDLIVVQVFLSGQIGNQSLDDRQFGHIQIFIRLVLSGLDTISRCNGTSQFIMAILGGMAAQAVTDHATGKQSQQALHFTFCDHIAQSIGHDQQHIQRIGSFGNILLRNQLSCSCDTVNDHLLRRCNTVNDRLLCSRNTVNNCLLRGGNAVNNRLFCSRHTSNRGRIASGNHCGYLFGRDGGSCGSTHLISHNCIQHCLTSVVICHNIGHGTCGQLDLCLYQGIQHCFASGVICHNIGYGAFGQTGLCLYQGIQHCLASGVICHNIGYGAFGQAGLFFY